MFSRCKIALSISVLSLVISPAVFSGPLPAPLVDSDFYENGAPNSTKVQLGKFLFFDKELSGNRNIACATCHHSLTDTGDGLSLPVGEGGNGLGMTRDTGYGSDAVHERVPRNAPPVFMLGTKQFNVMFHDGRVELDPNMPSGISTPAGNNLPNNLENPLAAQAMFPVTSGTEMAGQAGENPIADASAAGNLAGPGGVWELIADRLRVIPEYASMFVAAFDDVNSAADIRYSHAANAIAAFEGVAWRADNSAFDRYLRGDRRAMSNSAKKGMKLFYGSAGCSGCHSGVLQTDLSFHAIAMPQIGKGKGDGVDGHEDFGRERVTGNINDRYKFRTPTLRNVALTGPWGHGGAYDTLRAVVMHHMDTTAGIQNYNTDEAVLPSRADLDVFDFIVQNDAARVANIAAASELPPKKMSKRNMNHLMDFLNALTDPGSIDIRADTPRYVPSGLPLGD